MSYEDFTASTKPKVAGSWNLHAFLPKGMDFFILLSSICGIFGAASQVNYCTGNTYKDALAQFRIAHGEKAVSLDLGMMINEGVVAENESLMGFLRRTGYFMEISQPELFALLDHYCDPALPILTPLDCQIIIGIEIPEVLNAAGLDQPEWMRRPMFRHFHQMVSGNAVSSLTGPDSAPDYAVLLRTADSGASAAAVVSEAITNKIAKVMGIQPEDIDLSKPMHSYGVDSLVAVEVRNWLLRDLGADVAIFDILGSASLAEMSGTIASGSSHRN